LAGPVFYPDGPRPEFLLFLFFFRVILIKLSMRGLDFNLTLRKPFRLVPPLAGLSPRYRSPLWCLRVFRKAAITCPAGRAFIGSRRPLSGDFLFFIFKVLFSF